MTLQQKQTLTCSLIKKWKKLLKLTDYSHKTLFYDEKNRLEDKDNIAAIVVDPDKHTFVLRFNNDELKRREPKNIEHYVVHELAHVFYSKLTVLFSNIIATFNEKTQKKLDKTFDNAEHKEIYKLIKIFKQIKH